MPSPISSYAEHEISRLRALAPPIAAAGVGGSLGRGDADRDSDLDIFAFFDDGDAFVHAAWLLQQLQSALDPVSCGPIKFSTGYGACLSFVLADLRKLEYFINTPSSWTQNPMRANTNIQFDLTGTCSRLVQECASSAASTQHEALEGGLHELLLEALNLRKYARRQDAWSMQYRIAAMRRQLVAVLLAATVQRPFDVQTGMAHVDALPEPTATALELTLPTASPPSAARVLRTFSTLVGDVAQLTLTGDPRWSLIIVTLDEASDALES
jgi:hypothetical protein